MAYDSVYNGIRVALVSGSSATEPNIFLFFDLVDKVWSFDNLGQKIGCMTEVEAGSGDVTIIQVGGGNADGTVYQLNTTDDDVSTAIDSYATMELDAGSAAMWLREMSVRVKAQSAGNLTLTFLNEMVSAGSKTLAMQAKITNNESVTDRFNLNIIGKHISVKMQNDTASESLYLEDIGLGIEEASPSLSTSASYLQHGHFPCKAVCQNLYRLYPLALCLSFLTSTSSVAVAVNTPSTTSAQLAFIIPNLELNNTLPYVTGLYPSNNVTQPPAVPLSSCHTSNSL